MGLRDVFSPQQRQQTNRANMRKGVCNTCSTQQYKQVPVYGPAGRQRGVCNVPANSNITAAHTGPLGMQIRGYSYSKPTQQTTTSQTGTARQEQQTQTQICRPGYGCTIVPAEALQSKTTGNTVGSSPKVESGIKIPKGYHVEKLTDADGRPIADKNGNFLFTQVKDKYELVKVVGETISIEPGEELRNVQGYLFIQRKKTTVAKNESSETTTSIQTTPDAAPSLAIHESPQGPGTPASAPSSALNTGDESTELSANQKAQQWRQNFELAGPPESDPAASTGGPSAPPAGSGTAPGTNARGIGGITPSGTEGNPTVNGGDKSATDTSAPISNPTPPASPKTGITFQLPNSSSPLPQTNDGKTGNTPATPPPVGGVPVVGATPPPVGGVPGVGATPPPVGGVPGAAPGLRQSPVVVVKPGSGNTPQLPGGGTTPTVASRPKDKNDNLAADRTTLSGATESNIEQPLTLAQKRAVDAIGAITDEAQISEGNITIGLSRYKRDPETGFFSWNLSTGIDKLNSKPECIDIETTRNDYRIKFTQNDKDHTLTIGRHSFTVTGRNSNTQIGDSMNNPNRSALFALSDLCKSNPDVGQFVYDILQNVNFEGIYGFEYRNSHRLSKNLAAALTQKEEAESTITPAPASTSTPAAVADTTTPATVTETTAQMIAREFGEKFQSGAKGEIITSGEELGGAILRAKNDTVTNVCELFTKEQPEFRTIVGDTVYDNFFKHFYTEKDQNPNRGYYLEFEKERLTSLNGILNGYSKTLLTIYAIAEKHNFKLSNSDDCKAELKNLAQLSTVADQSTIESTYAFRDTAAGLAVENIGTGHIVIVPNSFGWNERLKHSVSNATIEDMVKDKPTGIDKKNMYTELMAKGNLHYNADTKSYYVTVVRQDNNTVDIPLLLGKVEKAALDAARNEYEATTFTPATSGVPTGAANPEVIPLLPVDDGSAPAGSTTPSTTARRGAR